MRKWYHKKSISDETLEKLEELKVKCKCGHTIIMPVQYDYIICSHCKRKVKNNTKEWFKYNLYKAIRK